MDNLNNPEKWEATSHPDLCELKPDGLFQPKFAERYIHLHNDLWQRLVRLHGTIHTLEQLKHVPFNYLYCVDNMEFWYLAKYNFFGMAIVSLHSLVNDQASDSHTIPKFKNEIATGPWLDQGMRDLFRQTLRERKFNGHVRSIAERVGDVRHNLVHRLIDTQTGYPKEDIAEEILRDLRELLDATHAMFGALSFGSAYATLAGDLIPGTIGGIPTRTCLDEVLDAVIRNSYFVNEPELKQLWWADLRKRKAPEELKILNELRKRVGLPEA